MKRYPTLFLALVVAALLTTSAGAQRSGGAAAALEAAKQKAIVSGDLNAAIKQYGAIADKYTKSDPAVAAMALVMMAQAHGTRGDVESRRIYERVLKEFPQQKEAVTLARAGIGEDSTAGPVYRTIWTSSPSSSNPDWSRLSPDGRFVSFATREDVWLREISTGQDRKLTNNQNVLKEHAFESIFSPDGRQVAYLWQKDNGPYTLWIANVSGDANPRRIYDNPPDAYDLILHDWSRDGRIAVTVQRQDRTVQIGWVSLSDGMFYVWKTVDWANVGGVRISPDGKHVGYDRSQSDNRQARDVFVLAADGSGDIPVVEDPDANDRLVGWSPDGKWLLFTSDRFGSADLWAVAFTDGKAKGTPQRLRTNVGNFQPLGWTPAGALYWATRPSSTGVSNVQLASLDLTAGTFRSTTMASRSYQERTRLPKWSADGKRLAYLSTLRGADKIVIRATDTETVRELSPRQLGGLIIEAWAPDGRSLLVSAFDLRGQIGVYRVDVETGESSAVVLNRPGVRVFSGLVDWMPDGHSFVSVFTGSEGGYYRVDTQTNDVAELVLYKTKPAFPPPFAFSPDGRTAYLQSPRDLAGAVATDAAFLAKDLVTGNERELIRRSNLGALNLSPDGRFIATRFIDTATDSSVVLLIPTSGGEIRELTRVRSDGAAGIRVAPLAWTPDGGSLLVRKEQADRTRPVELWLVSLAGGDPKRVTGDIGIPASAAISVSPDGRHFTYTITERAPQAGSEVAVLESFLPKQATK